MGADRFRTLPCGIGEATPVSGRIISTLTTWAHECQRHRPGGGIPRGRLSPQACVMSAIRAENEPDDTFRREAGAGLVARRYATELLGCQRRTDADVLAYDHAGVAVQSAR